MHKRLTQATLAIKAPATGRMEVRDTMSPLLFRVTSNGARSLSLRTRFEGKQIRFTYPRAATAQNLGDARDWANRIIEKCKNGIDPREEQRRLEIEAGKKTKQLFENVVEEFMRRHAVKNKTAGETQRIFERYVLPEWRGQLITELSRSDVILLLDKIEDGKIKGRNGVKFGGPVMADRTLAAIRKLFNWYAVRDDRFTAPVVSGMARTKPRMLARTRVLSDDEIAVMWPLLDQFPTFGVIVKLLFLTAQRRGEVAEMQRGEVGADGIWAIPPERYKTKTPVFVPLSKDAKKIIDAQPIIDDCEFVFSTNGKTAFSGFSKSKAKLDELMIQAIKERAKGRGEKSDKVTVENWRLHDIRRTAKTLMTRAGVRPDISERVLGHAISGVEGVYDRHSYLDEKRDALDKLAGLISEIVAAER